MNLTQKQVDLIKRTFGTTPAGRLLSFMKMRGETKLPSRTTVHNYLIGNVSPLIADTTKELILKYLVDFLKENEGVATERLESNKILQEELEGVFSS